MLFCKNHKVKTQLIFFSIILSSFAIVSFNPDIKKKENIPEFSIKDIDKSVIQISDSLYAGKYEVSNLQYRFWGNDIIKNNQTDLMNIFLPDTLNWLDKSSYYEPLVEYYFRHPAYQDYPVVNISYEATEKYCEWLTEKYNADPKRHFNKVLFRLPTATEWETAAKGGSEYSRYPWGDRLIQEGKVMCNYMGIGDECINLDTLKNELIIHKIGSNPGIAGNLNDDADITAPVNSYEPNKFGLYNVCGNVAEMISEKGISRGGGWKSTGGDVRIKSVAAYTKSACDLGFRYFMEIIEK